MVGSLQRNDLLGTSFSSIRLLEDALMVASFTSFAWGAVLCTNTFHLKSSADSTGPVTGCQSKGRRTV